MTEIPPIKIPHDEMCRYGGTCRAISDHCCHPEKDSHCVGWWDAHDGAQCCGCGSTESYDDWRERQDAS